MKTLRGPTTSNILRHFSVVRPYNILPVPPPVIDTNTWCVCFREKARRCPFFVDQKTGYCQSKVLCIFLHSLERRFSIEKRGLQSRQSLEDLQRMISINTIITNVYGSKVYRQFKNKQIYKMLYSRKVDHVE